MPMKAVRARQRSGAVVGAVAGAVVDRAASGSTAGVASSAVSRLRRRRRSGPPAAWRGGPDEQDRLAQLGQLLEPALRLRSVRLGDGGVVGDGFVLSAGGVPFAAGLVRPPPARTGRRRPRASGSAYWSSTPWYALAASSINSSGDRCGSAAAKAASSRLRQACVAAEASGRRGSWPASSSGRPWRAGSRRGSWGLRRARVTASMAARASSGRALADARPAAGGGEVGNR